MEKFLAKQGENLFWVLMVSGVAPVFFYNTEFNAPHIFAFKYFLLPITVLCYWITFKYMNNWRRKVHKSAPYFMPFVWSLMITLFSGGYVTLINAHVGSQKQVEVEGEILKKGVAGSKSKEYYLEVQSDKGVKKVTVPLSHFNSYEEGGSYKDIWYQGSLGILYKK